MIRCSKKWKESYCIISHLIKNIHIFYTLLIDEKKKKKKKKNIKKIKKKKKKKKKKKTCRLAIRKHINKLPGEIRKFLKFY